VARVERGPQLPAHLGARDHALAIEVAAALGKGLVLQLHHGRAGALERAHRALRVQGVAEAGIAVHDDGQRDPFRDARERVGHLGRRGQSDIGAAEARVGDGGAREVQGLEAGLFRNEGGERVVNAGGEDGGRGLQPLPEGR